MTYVQLENMLTFAQFISQIHFKMLRRGSPLFLKKRGGVSKS